MLGKVIKFGVIIFIRSGFIAKSLLGVGVVIPPPGCSRANNVNPVLVMIDTYVVKNEESQMK